MDYYLQLKKSNCKNCYKCIRHCPVKSIRFSDNQAHIVKEECILCGQCFVNCPQGAKQIRNDVDRVRALLSADAPVYASVAPSFVANYPGSSIDDMAVALKKLGFAGAFETAVGATDVKRQYDAIVDTEKQSIVISSCCHSVNTLIQKHFPEALPYLAHVLSPMQAHCTAIKKQFPGSKTVFIGPCISKKAEADQYEGIVDCVLTFEELTGWIAEAKLEIGAAPDRRQGGIAALFPTTGGILRSMACDNPAYTYLTIDGVNNCMDALNDIVNGRLDHCFIEMSACVGSCIGGPAMDRDKHAPIRDFCQVDRYAGKHEFEVPVPVAAEKEKEFPFLGIAKSMPGSKAIDEILKKMGKTKPEDELNCGSCGYNSCRDKAIAVLNGKADLTMCLPFLKEKAESFSDIIIENTPNGIVVLNEAYEVQQINSAALKLMNLSDSGSILGDQVVRILDPEPFFTVVREGKNIHDKRVYLAEYRCYVEQTVIYDREYHLIMCIMRDVTGEELHKSKRDNISRQTIEITDKVVEKQMRVVQEIASLLGETTAETKIALTKLKESLSDE